MLIGAFTLKCQKAIPPKGSFVRTLFAKHRMYLDLRITLLSLIFAWGGFLGSVALGIYLLAMDHSTAESVYRTAPISMRLIPTFIIMAIGMLVKVRDGAPHLIELARCLGLELRELSTMSEEAVKSCVRQELVAATDRSDEPEGYEQYHRVRIRLARYNLLPMPQNRES